MISSIIVISISIRHQPINKPQKLDSFYVASCAI